MEINFWLDWSFHPLLSGQIFWFLDKQHLINWHFSLFDISYKTLFHFIEMMKLLLQLLLLPKHINHDQWIPINGCSSNLQNLRMINSTRGRKISTHMSELPQAAQTDVAPAWRSFSRALTCISCSSSQSFGSVVVKVTHNPACFHFTELFKTSNLCWSKTNKQNPELKVHQQASGALNWILQSLRFYFLAFMNISF